MREEIISIINEISNIGDNVYHCKNLVSGKHLDSFSVLMLVTQLEDRFNVSLELNDELFVNLDSVERIEKLINESRV